MVSHQTLYRIRSWSEIFENSQSRQYQRLSWVPIPNKHDGKSYRRLIAHDDGPALYAAWLLIVQVASKCPVRGVLADADGPLDADDLAAKTGCPATVFAKAFELLTHPKIAWLQMEQLPADQQHATSGPPVTLGSPPLNGTEWNRPESEQKKPPPPPTPTTPNADHPDASWKAVEADFSILGLADVSGTITLAQARGYSSQQVARLIEHYRASPGQWDAAAIAWRIGHSPSDRAFDQGWPKPHDTTSTQSGDVERLETTYAKQLNGMSETELLAAMERAGIPANKMAHCRQPGTSFRAQLLAKLASDAISNRSPPADSSKPK